MTVPAAPPARAGKRHQVTGLVRDMIADGVLKPGAPVPSGASLARRTGFSVLTCRNALRALLRDGTLIPGPSPNARLRVTSTEQAADGHAAALRLSASLASHRHAARLTQPDLAAKLDRSVTTVGHAETGRVWQSRDFWCQADLVLSAGGVLVDLYDDLKAAEAAEGCPPQAHAPRVDAPPAIPPQAAEPAAGSLAVMPSSVAITAGGVLVTWPDGTQTLATPPGDQPDNESPRDGAVLPRPVPGTIGRNHPSD